MTKAATYEFKGEQFTKDQLLEKWYSTAGALALAKAEESVLRNLVVTGFFPDGLKEGTQTLPLADGWVLKVAGKVNRKIDPAMIGPVTLEMAAKFGDANVTVDDLINYPPELKISAYKTLTAEQRQVFDAALIITDGTPAVIIDQPKRGVPKPVAK